MDTSALWMVIQQAYTRPTSENDPFPMVEVPNDYDAIAAKLNAPTVTANPVTEPAQVLAPITLKSVMAAVPPAEMVATYQQMPTFVADLKTAIDGQDREYMAGLLTIAATAGVISGATVAALQALLTATVADPTWTAEVAGPSLAQTAGLGTVSAIDVQKALNQW